MNGKPASGWRFNLSMIGGLPFMLALLIAATCIWAAYWLVILGMAVPAWIWHRLTGRWPNWITVTETRSVVKTEDSK